MPNGGTLMITTKVVSKCIEISFQDTGEGIPDKIKESIFDPFFTLSYQKGKKGTGLGLSISYTIVKEHGGNIEVESEEGKGSTFRVMLPVKSSEFGVGSSE